jgi:transketolase
MAMRQKVCDALVARAEKPDLVFLTGDLGFMALEPVRDRLGERFINCGVAEQNMVSVAAALAKEGFEVWVYSIAPFCYARAFEQIRNDICTHQLPVRLLGNGGGYGYGVMGPTHHAIEDYGMLLTLPMRIFVPAFNDDVTTLVANADDIEGPCYIRLGRDEGAKGAAAPSYSAWRRLSEGDGPVVVTLGPLASCVLEAFAEIGHRTPEIWLVSELPLISSQIPSIFALRVQKAKRLCVVEEHVAHGGLGSMVCRWLVERGINLRAFRHLHAPSRPCSRSGSQTYLRRQSGLDPDSIRAAVMAIANS